MSGRGREIKRHKFSYAEMGRKYGSKGESPARRKKSANSGGGRSFAAKSKRIYKRKTPATLSKRPGGKKRAKKGSRMRRRQRRAYTQPKWFKQLMKDQTPFQMVSQKMQALFNADNLVGTPPVEYKVGMCNWYTMFKCRSPKDIENAMKFQPLKAAAGSVPLSANRFRSWMFNAKRVHTWRNNQENTPANMQFFTLVPRRDMARAGVAVIGPAPSDDIVVGAQLNPTMLVDGFDEVESSNITDQPFQPVNIPFYHPEATPFMSSKVARCFKIVPMKVKWPDGTVASKGTLQPGQEVCYTANAKKPLSMSYDKWGFYNDSTAILTNAYDVLMKTPLILVKKWGVVTHSDLNPNLVNSGFARIDWTSKFHCEVLCTWQKSVRMQTFDRSSITGLPAPVGPYFTDPEAGIEVTADDSKEMEVGLSEATGTELNDGTRKGQACPPPKKTLAQRMEELLQAARVIEEEDDGEMVE